MFINNHVILNVAYCAFEQSAVSDFFYWIKIQLRGPPFQSNKIVFEDRNGTMLYYLYNGDELLGFVYNGNTYYYHKNVFGDIIGILNSNYEEIVTYEYDSWGAISNIIDNSEINLGTINPFRYRSYYYDEETKLYYLNSRYYNPEWGRFINEDVYLSTGQGFEGFNMFNYCSNNPVERLDKNGKSFISSIVIGALAGGLSQVISNVINGEKWNSGLGSAVVIGACSGLVGGAVEWVFEPIVYGVKAQMLSSAGGTILGNATSSLLNYEYGMYTKQEAIMDFTLNTIIGVSSVPSKVYSDLVTSPKYLSSTSGKIVNTSFQLATDTSTGIVVNSTVSVFNNLNGTKKENHLIIGPKKQSITYNTAYSSNLFFNRNSKKSDPMSIYLMLLNNPNPIIKKRWFFK